jgi:hypothetical protein
MHELLSSLAGIKAGAEQTLEFGCSLRGNQTLAAWMRDAGDRIAILAGAAIDWLVQAEAHVEAGRVMSAVEAMQETLQAITDARTILHSVGADGQ